jgi:hypothetical protein
LGAEDLGTVATDYLIVGPNTNDVPSKGYHVVRAATNLVWVVGRFAVEHTEADYNRVYQLESQLVLEPVESYALGESPEFPDLPNPKNLTIPWQMFRMDPHDYFSFLGYVLKKNPPLEQDAKIVKELALLGLWPVENFDWDKLTSAQRTALTNGVLSGRQEFWHYGQQRERHKYPTGWNAPKPNAGNFGTDYVARAIATVYGIGGNVPKIAIYFSARADRTGALLNGSKLYKVHFDADKIPPTRAFWSFTAYNPQLWLAQNGLNRYSLGSLYPELQKNADGSVDIYFSHSDPGQPNWLPTPSGPVTVVLRTYWPEEPILNGTWTPPAIVECL